MKNIDNYDKLTFFLKQEFNDFSKKEKIVFFLIALIIIFSSIALKDGKIAILSSICGISYTIFNGKGKIYCYFFGITSSLCYSYLAFKNGFWGNFGLNFLYYFPLQIYGIINWKKHLKKNTLSVKKKKLSGFIEFFLFCGSITTLLILGLIIKFKNYNFINFLDFSILILSIIAMVLAVKRCIEQWYFWSIVNLFSIILWLIAFLKGSGCFALILMWIIYFILGIYFLFQWKKEIQKS